MILSKHSWKVGTILCSRNSPGNVYQTESILNDDLSLNITSLIHRKLFKNSYFFCLHFSKLCFLSISSVLLVLFFFFFWSQCCSLHFLVCIQLLSCVWILQPHGLQSARLLCWCNFPGKSIQRIVIPTPEHPSTSGIEHFLILWMPEGSVVMLHL